MDAEDRARPYLAGRRHSAQGVPWSPGSCQRASASLCSLGWTKLRRSTCRRYAWRTPAVKEKTNPGGLRPTGVGCYCYPGRRSASRAVLKRLVRHCQQCAICKGRTGTSGHEGSVALAVIELVLGHCWSIRNLFLKANTMGRVYAIGRDGRHAWHAASLPAGRGSLCINRQSAQTWRTPRPASPWHPRAGIRRLLHTAWWRP